MTKGTNGMGSCLFMVGVPAAFIAMVVAWICDSFFHLSEVALGWVVIGVFVLMAAAFLMWLIHCESKAREITHSTEHPTLGRVDFTRRIGWRSMIDVPGLDEKIQVESFHVAEPTGAQIETVQWIQANGSKIAGSIDSWFENLSDEVVQRFTPPIIIFSSIQPDPNVSGNFRVVFNYQNRRPSGYTGVFENEKLLQVE